MSNQHLSCKRRKNHPRMNVDFCIAVKCSHLGHIKKIVADLNIDGGYECNYKKERGMKKCQLLI